MTTVLQTPTWVGELSSTGGVRTYRKQVLPVGSIEYGGRTLDFTEEYLKEVERAFHDEAFDTVPFVLADGENKHTMEPERAHGTVTDLTAEGANGLWATVTLNETAARLVEEQPKLGVSVRVIENLKRADGKTFRAAMQHLLGTFDPKVTGMSPWQAVALSSDRAGDVIVDLSATRIELGETGRNGEEMPKEEGSTGPVAGLTKEELDKLQELDEDDMAALAEYVNSLRDDEDDDDDDEKDPDGPGDEGSEGDSEGAPGDGENGSQQPEPVGAGVGLSNPADGGSDALELANAAIEQQRVELAQMRSEIDESRFAEERDKLVRRGVPPAVVDLAKPLLRGSGHTVELSNPQGQTERVDAGAVLRGVLEEYAKLGGYQLSEPVGFATDLSEDERESEKNGRDAFVSHYREQFSL